MLSLCACQTGRYTDALSEAELAVALIRQHGFGFEVIAHLRLAACWRHMGQWTRVQQILGLPLVQESVLVAPLVNTAMLQHHLASALGRSTGTFLQEALIRLPPGERPDLRLPLRVEYACTQEAEAALQQLDEVRREAQALQHEGTVLATLVRAAGIAAELDPTAAAQHARAALALSARRQSTMLLPAELWLHCARALHAAGDTDQAAQLLVTGRDWLQRTAREQVPEPFRDSFFNRNPVNAALLALASRLAN